MKVVLFFEFTRKRDRMFRVILGSVIGMLCLFLLCTLIDLGLPEFNSTYMQLPNVIADLLYLKTWNPHLWFNVWQIASLGYSFYFIYVFMTGMGNALSEEERYETMVYLMNTGVTPSQMFVGKGIFWMGGAFVACMAMMMENLLFALLLHTTQGAMYVVSFYSLLFFAGVIYMAIVMFRVAERGKRGASLDFILLILIVPLICAWIPAFLRTFSVLSKSWDVQQKVVEGLMSWGNRLEVFTLFSPLKWCWPGSDVGAVYIVCGSLLILVLMAAAFSIYVQRKWCDN